VYIIFTIGKSVTLLQVMIYQ